MTNRLRDRLGRSAGLGVRLVVRIIARAGGDVVPRGLVARAHGELELIRGSSRTQSKYGKG